MSRRPRVAVSACFFHADPERAIFKGKSLLYLEESMGHYLWRGGAVPYMVPSWLEPADIDDMVSDFDGLLLQGGADVSPLSYGEEPLQPNWGGDKVRDDYEIALYRRFVAAKKPVLGICRGIQVLNTAEGGTLYQDIETQHPDKRVHRDWEVYDNLTHGVRFEAGSLLGDLYGESGTINSVHHQAIKEVAANLVPQAWSEGDDIVEAVKRQGEPWVLGVQWHPEFQRDEQNELIDPLPIVKAFVQACADNRRK